MCAHSVFSTTNRGEASAKGVGFGHGSTYTRRAMSTAQRLARAGALALLVAAACSRGTGGSSGGNSGSDVATLDDVRALCAASCDESGRCTGTPGTDCGCRAKVEPFVDVLSRSALATARDCLAECIDEDACDTRVYDS